MSGPESSYIVTREGQYLQMVDGETKEARWSIYLWDAARIPGRYIAGVIARMMGGEIMRFNHITGERGGV